MGLPGALLLRFKPCSLSLPLSRAALPCLALLTLCPLQAFVNPAANAVGTW